MEEKCQKKKKATLQEQVPNMSKKPGFSVSQEPAFTQEPAAEGAKINGLILKL